jgi:hypothetical protein
MIEGAPTGHLLSELVSRSRSHKEPLHFGGVGAEAIYTGDEATALVSAPKALATTRK